MHRFAGIRKSFGAYLMFLGALFPVLTFAAFFGYHPARSQHTLSLPLDMKSATDSSRDSVSILVFSTLGRSVTDRWATQDSLIRAEGIRNYSTVSLRALYGDGGPGMTPIELRILTKTTGLYRHPTNGEKEALLEVVGMVYRGVGSPEAEFKAQALAQGAGYELARLTVPGGLTYFVLQPKGFAVGDFTANPGFGIFVFNPAGDKDIILEAPHPRSDLRSTDLALVALERIPAFALLIAGADRRANLSPGSGVTKTEHVDEFNGDISDVSFADNTGSLFHQTHVLLTSLIVKDKREPFVFQFHGFSERDDGNAWPDIVLSNGVLTQEGEPLELTFLKKELLLRGHSASVYTTRNPLLRELSATHNPQGIQTRIWGTFIHIETGYQCRAKASLEDTAYSLAEGLRLMKINRAANK